MLKPQFDMFFYSVRSLKKSLFIPFLLFSFSSVAGADYSQHPKASAFIDDLVKEGFNRAYVVEILSEAKKQPSILEAIARPAERRLTWGEYRRLFITDKTIVWGLEFWRQHAKTLARAEEEFGVPAEIILAILGVETRYGRNMGKHRVLDALATLGFDYPKRSKFFLGQLKELFFMVREKNLELRLLKGSYAGAMGFGQFIPSSYRSYAVDYDGDGISDIINNPVDAIGSIANYFKQHRWRKGEMVRTAIRPPIKLDDSWINQGLKPKVSISKWHERGVNPYDQLDDDALANITRLEMRDGFQFWLTLHNFYVITRYNHSRLYASAVYELSRELANEREKIKADGTNKS